jgi:hypothetical protein
VLNLLQHFPLIVRMLNLLHLHDLLFLEDLDGVKALVVLRLDEVHSTEGASS